jgi:TonB family protein
MRTGNRLASIAVALALGIPAAAAEEGPLTLAPSSKWNAHYADDFCRLSRSFGEGPDQIMLFIDRFAPSDSFRLILAGKMMGRMDKRATATLRFGSVLPEQTLDFFPGSIGNDVPAWVFGETTRIRPYSEDKDNEPVEPGAPISAEEEASVMAIHIGRPLWRPTLLQTGSMTGAFAALRTCTDELMTHWGIDVERHRTLTRAATPAAPPGSWIKSNDYPANMLAKWQPGLVQFRLIVGADGVPTACHIQQSTNSGGFDEAVCKGLMKRARFEPALDAEGKPILSVYINLVRFQMR